jgi:Fur family peroxide stress response transcriptional regulator
MLSIEHVRELFHKYDLRCTRQRELVYTALASTKSHPTAEELYQAIHAVDPCLSLATVYNTLEAFTECGLTRRLAPTGTGPCRYDGDVEPHVHVSMTDGRMVDVPEDLSGRIMAGLTHELLAELEQRMGIEVGQLNLQIVARRGTRAHTGNGCAKCSV